MRQVYVEVGVRMAFDTGAAVWSFDADLWGTCVQGPTTAAALQAFERQHGPATVAELVQGDERAFDRDRRPAGDAELRLTLEALTRARRRSMDLLERLPDHLLDRDDPVRTLPSWAGWRTVRSTLWHIADTECRYYLPSLGLPARDRADDLAAELRESAAHVRRVITAMPRDVFAQGRESWSSTKLLRRLAWHEAGEVKAMEALVASWSSD